MLERWGAPFQSLTGRLKTYNWCMQAMLVDLFQSLTGRLKTARSTKTALSASMGEFQSLTGRLKTLVRKSHLHELQVFQSLTGRLKTQLAAPNYGDPSTVSIPHR